MIVLETPKYAREPDTHVMMQMDAPIPTAAAPEAFLKYHDMSCFVGFKPWDKIVELVFKVRYLVRFMSGFCKVSWLYNNGFMSRDLFMVKIRGIGDSSEFSRCFPELL